ncbi:unnamed protein product [Adineta steineri]|uniref:Leucine-rich repeat domain-containing protein n=1 Tax=Adineta steineri TaxID=433720 RepID=A0A818P6G4_9BILA|nr:unnamed protein product [Adineta steineri]
MMSLQYLTVDNNNDLSSLDALNGYQRLRGLSASNCAIDHLPTNLSTLTTIDMSKNKLTSLDGLDTLIWFDCKSLVFRNNSITTIPTTMRVVRNINTMDLSNNLLTELPIWLFNANLNMINVLRNSFNEREVEWIRGLYRSSNTTVYV